VSTTKSVRMRCIGRTTVVSARSIQLALSTGVLSVEMATLDRALMVSIAIYVSRRCIGSTLVMCAITMQDATPTDVDSVAFTTIDRALEVSILQSLSPSNLQQL
jgi:hypothetical protein